MKRIYNIKEECKKLKCSETKIRQMLTEELANEFMPTTDFEFRQISPDTLEIEIMPEQR